MKKIIIMLLITSSAIAVTDFQKRFGSNSALYNEPLYFSQRNSGDAQDKRPRRSYREQIRARIKRQDMQKKR